jgi:hypothetical protein
MKWSREHGTFWSLVLSVAIGVAAAACSGSPQEDVSSVAAPVRSVIVCGTTADGDPEIYMLRAMNNKLRHYPDFAVEIGMHSVNDCGGARTFQLRYLAYAETHRGFDINEPREYEPGPPLKPPAGPPPEITTSKILHGTFTPSDPAVTPVNPVVQIVVPGKTFLSKDILRCSGTFIAKNWIATAAHCITRIAIEACIAAKIDPKAPECIPFFDEWHEWTINFAGPSGMDGDPNATQVVRILAASHVDPLWTGTNLSTNDTVQDGGFFASNLPRDFALLEVTDDRVLPPNPELDGAKRILLSPPRSDWAMHYAGWGKPGGGLRSADASAASTLQVPDVLDDTIRVRYLDPIFSQPVCKGDSGGPIFHDINVTEPPGLPQGVNILLGTLTGGGGSLGDGGNPDCTNVNTGLHFDYWPRIDLEVPFIEMTIGRSLGDDNFQCRRFSTPELDYAKCWGKTCDIDCDCDDPLTEYCRGSGSVLDAEGLPCTRCGAPDAKCGPTTANGGKGCVKGQCIKRRVPLPPLGPSDPPLCGPPPP